MALASLTTTVRELVAVSRLFAAAVCVRANERAVDNAKGNLADALDAYDRALADLRTIEHREHGARIPAYVRALMERAP